MFLRFDFTNCLTATSLPGFRACLFFLCLMSLLLSSSCNSSRFPEMSAGAYAGKINGLVQGSNADFSLYAESLDNGNSLLFVVFADGWSPQMLRFRGGKAALVLNHDGITHTLQGDRHSNTLRGTVSSSNGLKGNWELRPVAKSELQQATSTSPLVDNLSDWLKVKARFNLVADEIAALRVSHEQDIGKFEKLERFVKNESVLRDRSKSRKDALATELNKITEQRKKSTLDLKSALNDLALINRATKEGQIVELNRRIQRRENKWFAINWAGSGEGSNIEEQLAAEDQVDLKKLNAAVRKAEEIHRLENAVESEQRRIEELETALNQTIRVIERPPLPPARTAPPDEQKPWWKVWNNQHE